MNKKLQRNLSLLYIFSFLRFFAFWQPIEQLFVYSIGGTTAVIGIGVALWTLSQFIFEIPSGYISDKFGKKKVFYIAEVARISGYLFIALPKTIPTYYVGLFLFGIAMAFISGSDKALLHDTLTGLNKQKEYRKISGRMNGLSTIGVMTAGLLAVLVARLGYNYNYLLSVIPQLLVVIAVVPMFEPKAHTRELLKNPTRDMFVALKSIGSTTSLQLLVLLAGTMEIVKRINMDFGQAFLLVILGSVAFVPALWVLGAGARAVSNFIAHKVNGHTWQLVGITLVTFLLMSFGPRQLAPFLYILVFLPINIVVLQAEEMVQKAAPKHLRATTLSGMNMLINLLQIIPIVAIGWYMASSNAVSGYRAASTIASILMLCLYIVLRYRTKSKSSVTI